MKSNGQVAYEAYSRVRSDDLIGRPFDLWTSLPARLHSAWEAAAAAVVEHAVERGRGLPNTADCAQ